MNRFTTLIVMLIGCVTLLTAPDVYAQTSATQLQNPIGYNSIAEFIAAALRAMVMIAMPVITLFMVYSGFLFVYARGNEESLKQAKTNLIYVILGSVLILGAWAFASLIGGTLAQLTR